MLNAAPTPDPVAEAAHLRRLLETHPCCLIRVTTDGVLLAVNEAALSLLGAEGLPQVLGRPITDHIDPPFHAEWTAFVERTRTNGSASFECHLLSAAGPRASLVQGVALRDHPDGIDSLILAIRDTTASRRLEEALAAEETSRKHLEEMRSKLERAVSAAQQLAGRLAESESARQQLTGTIAERDAERSQFAGGIERIRSEHDAAQAELVSRHEQIVAEADAARAALVAERDAERVQAQAERTQADAERARSAQERAEAQARLDAAIEQHRAAMAERERLQGELAAIDAERKAERAQLEAYVEQQQLVVVEKEREHRESVARLKKEIADALERQERLASALESDRAERQTLDVEWAAARASFEQALRDAHTQLEQAHGQAEAGTADLMARLSTALTEKTRLERALEERDEERRRADAEHADARARLEQSLEEKRAEAEQNQAEADRARAEIERTRTELEAKLTALAREREERERSAAAEHAGHERALSEARARAEELVNVQAELERALAEEQSERDRTVAGRHAELERMLADEKARAEEAAEAHRRALAGLDAELSRAVAEQQHLAAVVSDRDVEQRRLADELDAVRSELERVRAEHAQQGDIAKDQAATIAALEQRLAREHDQTLSSREQEHRSIIAHLQAELALSMADQQRVQALLAQSEAEQKRLVAEYAADRGQAERALGEAMLKKNQILKVLADQRVELRQLADNSRSLEPLAAAGRLAVDVGRELQELTAEIDSRARFLLSLSTLESSYRSELETLRAEAIRAASLARQFTLVNARQAFIPFEAGADGPPARAIPSTETL